jgi:hypothetical protein
MMSSAPLSLVLLQMERDQSINHPSLAVADGRHVDRPFSDGDPELAAPADIAGDLRSMDHVLALEACQASISSLTLTRCRCG